ncbi:MAG: hypothetical protein ACI8WB_000453 [Phenylobacterium sp.]|jgi:hypothetical protein
MKPYSILHIDDTARFHQRMDRNYRHKYERIMAMPEVTTYDLGKPQKNLLARSYDVVMMGVFANSGCEFMLDGPLEAQNLAHIPLKCAILEDIHDGTFFGGWRALCQHLNQHYDFVIATYDCKELDTIKSLCPNIREFFILPHFIDTRTFHDYALAKTWDVLFYGNVRVEQYPFRFRLKNLLAQSNLTVKIIDHPGYAQYAPQICGANLARLINQAKITIATPSSDDYLVAKYVEISAANSMIAGQIASAGQSLWQGHYIHLDNQMSDQQIIDSLHQALLDPAKLASATEHMYSVIQDNYSLAAFDLAFESVIEKIILHNNPAHVANPPFLVTTQANECGQ